MAVAQTFTKNSLTTIPNWMSTIDFLIKERPVPTMEGPGMPQEWKETWSLLRVSLEHQSRAIKELKEQLQNSTEPLPERLIEWMGRRTLEPKADLNSIYLVETKRGLFFLSAPRFSPTELKNSLLVWTPWGKPGLMETGRFTGESAQIDPNLASPWVWAAWKRNILVSQVDWPVMTPPEYVIPNALARTSTLTS